jgi:sec-independent protein translocase protein TatB
LVRFAAANVAAPVLLPTNRMFSVPHLIVIFVVALVVFGPEKLPELARTLGKVMAEFKRATGDLRSTFEDHLRDLERETSERASDRKIGGGTSPTVPTPPLPSAEATMIAEGAPDAAALPPAPGAVTADEPYLSRASSAAPEPSPKDDPQHDPAAQPEPDPEKVSDGRKRPG